MTNTLENLILIGRPASGKSEFIDHIKKLSLEERVRKFRIGNFLEIDDHPWLWEKFMEDDMWEKLGYPRLCSKHYEDNNYGLDPKHPEYFELMMEKFNFEISKRYLSDPSFYNNNTLCIEFSRGGGTSESGHTAYKKNLQVLSTEILNRAVILYNKVSFEESCRKNNKRYEEKKKHSILAHKVTDEGMEAFYQVDDWDRLTSGKDIGRLTINGIKVPFATVNNEPESMDPHIIDERYSPALTKLYEMHKEK